MILYLLVEMFNSHYINIVEKTLGVPTENYFIDTNNTQEVIEGIIRKYERHPRHPVQLPW